MPLLSKKAINSVFLPWIFGDDSLLVSRKSVNTTSSIAVLIPVASGLIYSDDVFPKQWILITHGNEVSRNFRPFCFLLVCELVRHKSRADIPLIQIIADDGVHRVLANAHFLRNQS